MNHAVFWVTLRERASSQDEMPFLLFTASQRAGSHLDRGIGESSNTVPTLAENCFWHPLHFQIRRVARKLVSLPSQAGQTATPSGQRKAAKVARATSLLAK